MSRSGALISARESAIYLENKNGVLLVPSNVISAVFARELLLYVIEIFDDALVGFSEYSFNLGEITDKLFNEWRKAPGTE